MLEIIITLVLVVILLWAIMKKFNAAGVLFAISLVTLGAWQLVTGESVLGDASTGVPFFDLFEFLVQTASSQLSKNILLVMTVMGYVVMCDRLNASKMFALYASKPFQKAKNPWIVVVFVVVLGVFLKLAITSSVGLCSMLLATMYPIMRSMGVSRGTAATAVTLPGIVIWGPSDMHLYLAFSIAGREDISVVDFFTHYQIPMVAILLIVFAISVPLFSKYWDKQEAKKGLIASAEGEIKTFTAEELGVPKFYGIFPLMPLVIILIFSELVPGTPVISTGAAHWICLFAILVTDIVVKRKVKEPFNQIAEYFKGMGNYLAMGGMIMISASLFTSALTQVGGMTNLGQLVIGSNAGYAVTLAASVILGAVIAMFSQVSPALNIFVPLFVSVCAASGNDIRIMILALLSGACMGIACLPTSSSLIIASNTLGVSVPQIMKRNAGPAICGAIAVIITTLVMTAIGY